MLINNFKIEVIRKRVKNINLKVYPNLKIVATIPEFMDIQILKRMIILKEEWIKKQLDKFQEQDRTTRRNFVSGEDHYLNGKRYILKVLDSNSPSVKVENNKRIIMNVRKSSSLKNKENLMNRFYKEKLQEKLQVFIPIWEEKIGVKANKYKIRKMKNMWGSCNITKKEINFNLNLAKKKDSEIQYVIIYELLQLMQDKSNNIRTLMYKYCPKWEEYDESLNKLLPKYSNKFQTY